jgi:carboxyl-terminal processing protease
MKSLPRNAAMAAMVALLLVTTGCAHNPTRAPAQSAQPQTVGDLLGPATPAAPTAKGPAAQTQKTPLTPPFRPVFPNRQVKDHRPELSKKPTDRSDDVRYLRDARRELSRLQAAQTRARLARAMMAYYQAWNLIQQQHVHAPYAAPQMVEEAIKGLTKVTGDKYTRYLTAKQLKEMQASDDGEFGGIGAVLRWDKKTKSLLVERVMPDTPAAKAGLQGGDRIVLINGQPVAKLDLRKAVDQIRGKVGTKVRLRIRRQQKLAVRNLRLVITRAIIISRTVEFKIRVRHGKRLAYITVMNFHMPTLRDFRRAVKKCQQWKVDGIIIDLRFNPGGYVSVTQALASAWLPPDRILFHEIKPKVKRITVQIGAHAGISGAFSRLPTVVLVNGHSASASEILAGTLQDYGKATIIGAKTYGKGSVQTRHLLDNGGALLVTIRHWLTPKDRKINGVGLEPDIKVPWKLEEAVAGMGKPNDPQLQAAYDHLTGKRSVTKPAAKAKRPPKQKRVRPKAKTR